MLFCRFSVIAIALAASAAPAVAQSCPDTYSTCDNTGCCLSAEQCCPSVEDGCCSSSTPYCCGDGSCAATPSQCQLAGQPQCDGYDVPCGGGCAPAGSDCCDLVGHYCPPESMCTSDTTCVRGAEPGLAQLVAVATQTEEDASLSPPFEDPEDATRRSCGMGSAQGTPPPAWPWLIAVASLATRRYRARAVRYRARAVWPRP
jgi:hypothetical protein